MHEKLSKYGKIVHLTNFFTCVIVYSLAGDLI